MRCSCNAVNDVASELCCVHATLIAYTKGTAVLHPCPPRLRFIVHCCRVPPCSQAPVVRHMAVCRPVHGADVPNLLLPLPKLLLLPLPLALLSLDCAGSRASGGSSPAACPAAPSGCSSPGKAAAVRQQPPRRSAGQHARTQITSCQIKRMSHSGHGSILQPARARSAVPAVECRSWIPTSLYPGPRHTWAPVTTRSRPFHSCGPSAASESPYSTIVGTLNGLSGFLALQLRVPGLRGLAQVLRLVCRPPPGETRAPCTAISGCVDMSSHHTRIPVLTCEVAGSMWQSPPATRIWHQVLLLTVC